MTKISDETNQSRVRNLLSPILNYSAMLDDNDPRLKDLLEKERTQALLNLKKIYNLIEKQKTPDWLDKRYNNSLKEINKIRAAGFKVIAYCVMLCEDTFVFETDEIAHAAYERFERNSIGEDHISAWWYGKDNFFDKVAPEYEERLEKFDEIFYIKML